MIPRLASTLETVLKRAALVVATVGPLLPVAVAGVHADGSGPRSRTLAGRATARPTTPTPNRVARRRHEVWAAAIAVAVVVGVTLAGEASAATKRPITVTFVGDSVSASISYVPQARTELTRGFRVRLDLRVCRRLVQPSCSYEGSAPTTALQAVQGYGRSLGKVLIVKVGYNESASGYGRGVDRIMRAALAQGAAGVVWVTLRETRSTYRWTNTAIRSAAKRWPQMVVADWNAYSRGKPWFSGDGLHLTPAGADHLAAFLRPYVWKAAAGA